MGTVDDALRLAKSYIGYIEGPRDNQTIFGAYTGYNFQPWCGSFVKFVLDRTGTRGEPSPVWTPGGVKGYMSVGRFIPRTGNPRPGDVVFFDFGGSTSPDATDHVGFVESVDSSSTSGAVICIEGNTSSGAAGSQSNGGGCWRRHRSRNIIVGFGRPLYSGQAGVGPVPNTQETDEMSKLIDAPDGTIWLCTGAWRTKVSPDDASALQFIGTPRSKADPNFWGVLERSLADTAWAATAAWYSKLGPAPK